MDVNAAIPVIAQLVDNTTNEKPVDLVQALQWVLANEGALQAAAEAGVGGVRALDILESRGLIYATLRIHASGALDDALFVTAKGREVLRVFAEWQAAQVAG